MTSIPFPDWCKKISCFLTAGQKFKLETPIDNYALLPGWWHGTDPEDKKKIVGVIDLHEGFSPQCCKELMSHCHVPYADQQILLVCYEIAKKHPAQLEMGIPSEESVATAQDRVDVRAAYKAVGHVTDGLESFQLKPASKTGQALLDHMHLFALRDPKSKSKDGNTVVEPSSHLALCVSDHQREILLKSSMREITMRELMKNAGGQGATLKIAKQKLNVFAVIQLHSCMVNDEAQLEVLKNKMQLMASLAHIDWMKKADQ